MQYTIPNGHRETARTRFKRETCVSFAVACGFGVELKFRGIASGALLNIKCGSAVIPFVWHRRRSNKTIFRCKFIRIAILINLHIIYTRLHSVKLQKIRLFKWNQNVTCWFLFMNLEKLNFQRRHFWGEHVKNKNLCTLWSFGCWDISIRHFFDRISTKYTQFFSINLNWHQQISRGVLK